MSKIVCCTPKEVLPLETGNSLEELKTRRDYNFSVLYYMVTKLLCLVQNTVVGFFQKCCHWEQEISVFADGLVESITWEKRADLLSGYYPLSFWSMFRKCCKMSLAEVCEYSCITERSSLAKHQVH